MNDLPPSGDRVIERYYEGATGNGLVVEHTERGDGYVELWVAAPTDGPSVRIAAEQCRTLAADLVRRADLIDSAAPRPLLPSSWRSEEDDQRGRLRRHPVESPVTPAAGWWRRAIARLRGRRG